MRIVILGSGTGVPLAHRASPALLLQTGGISALFDPGPGTLRQMARIGIDFQFIDKIFVTHFHPDHTADLIHFLFAKKYFSKTQYDRPVTIAGPIGLTKFLERIQKAYGKWLRPPEGTVVVEELGTEAMGKMDCGSFTVSTRSTRHTTHSIAYRIDNIEGKTVVFSGDTGFCDEVIDLARDADLLVLECSLPEGSQANGHLTPSLAGKMAQLAGAKRLVLTHFYPECLKTDLALQCRSIFKGEMTLACDLLDILI